MSACRRSAVPKLQTCSCKAPVSSCCRFVSQHLRLGLLGLRETARLPAGPNQFEPDIGYHVKSGFCRWNGWSVEITFVALSESGRNWEMQMSVLSGCRVRQTDRLTGTNAQCRYPSIRPLCIADPTALRCWSHWRLRDQQNIALITSHLSRTKRVNAQLSISRVFKAP